MKIRNIRLEFNFSFFAVLSLSFLFDKSGISFMSLSAMLFHELGHLIPMMLFGCFPERIVFYGAGISINKKILFLNVNKRIIVLLSGCLVNLILGIISALLSDNIILRVYSCVNFTICLFNILPIGNFDGAMIADEIFTKHLSYRKAILFKRILSVIFSLLLIAFFIIISTISQISINISLLATCLYLLFSQFAF